MKDFSDPPPAHHNITPLWRQDKTPASYRHGIQGARGAPRRGCNVLLQPLSSVRSSDRCSGKASAVMPKMPAAGTSAVACLHVITTPFEPNLRGNAGCPPTVCIPIWKVFSERSEARLKGRGSRCSLLYLIVPSCGLLWLDKSREICFNILEINELKAQVLGIGQRPDTRGGATGLLCFRLLCWESMALDGTVSHVA